jgi:hypothetical protein
MLPAEPHEMLDQHGATRPMEVNMSSTDTSAEVPELGTIAMKLEVVTLPVSDVERANASTRASDGGWTPTSS